MKLIEYLIIRLNELGITDFFGLPGDYNFDIVEQIENNPNTSWIGCTNELNAGYVCDGYARVKGYACLVTTYGVGELSAMNAISGSFSENVPVFHIVGVPRTCDIEQNKILHHNFIEPDYFAFFRAYQNIVAKSCFLFKQQNLKQQIDELIFYFTTLKKPVYLAIPIDICKEKIDFGVLKKTYCTSNKEIHYEVKDQIIELINLNLSTTVVSTDILVDRFDSTDDLYKFLRNSNLPYFSSQMSKGFFDHINRKKFLGTFLGKFGNNTLQNQLDKSNTLVSIGTIYSDTNTFNTDIHKYNFDNIIEIQPTFTKINDKEYKGVSIKDILKLLSTGVNKLENNDTFHSNGIEFPKTDCENLTLDYIFAKLQDFFQENDSIFLDMGISKYGIAPMKMKKNSKIYIQNLYASIGWALPAAFGAMMAQKHSNASIILFIGEGAFQLTANELSNIIAKGFKPIIFLLNNSGYTIERFLSNRSDSKFNDVIPWKFSNFPYSFSDNIITKKIKTTFQLEEILYELTYHKYDKMYFLELFTQYDDIGTFAYNMTTV